MSKVFLRRVLYGNDLTGTIPSQISMLAKLSRGLYAQNGTFYWVLVIALLSVGLARLSLSLSRGFCHSNLNGNDLNGEEYCSFRYLSDTKIQPPSCRQNSVSNAAVQNFFRTCSHGMLAAWVHYDFKVCEEQHITSSSWLLVNNHNCLKGLQYGDVLQPVIVAN